MRITIIGTGYVGLVTGACMADLGNEVICLDVDRGKIDLLREGCVPIHEPGLAEIIARNRARQRLLFSADTSSAISSADLVVIAVGTPAGPEGCPDLQCVMAAAHAFGRYSSGSQVLVVKSTVPVGTAEQVRRAVAAGLGGRGVGSAVAVLSNPEFLREGTAVADFLQPERIVIGCADDEASRRGAALLRELYAPFGEERLLWMTPRAAELTKYAANAMLATRISFINEMANLADRLEVDIEAVRQGIGSDSRIGRGFLAAGCGYGGSCLPKDVQALRHLGRAHGCQLSLLDAVDQINRRQKQVLLEKIVRRYGSDLHGRRFAVWGLAFKPDTDDMREAPSRVLVRGLLEHGASLALHDPVALDEARRVLSVDLPEPGFAARVQYAAAQTEALHEADALVITTEWQDYRNPDFAQMKAVLRAPVIFDGRNLFKPEQMVAAGFEYHGIGRCCGVAA